MLRRTLARMRGFSLVELLVALFVLALLALAGWRGLDGMVRAHEYTRTYTDGVLTLQTVLAQWAADLDAVQAVEHTEPMDWDGQTLRLTRRGTHAPHAGPVVVAWTLRAGQWRRWQSSPVRTRGQWQQAWLDASLWGQQTPQLNTQPQETILLALQDWQIFYWRGNTWSNALSSVGSPSMPRTLGGLTETAARMPRGVRLQLHLPTGGALAGSITHDWVSALQGGGKS